MARGFTILKDSNKGFTLTELLLVVSILVIVSGVIMVNIHASERSLALDRSIHKVSQDIRGAMNLALSAKQFTGCAGTVSGYGIYFDTVLSDSSYLIYANCDADTRYSALSGDQIVKTVPLDTGVTIQSLSRDPLSIAFTPPNPNTSISNGADSSASITLQLKTQTRTLTINGKGVVDIQ
ncbi:MAG: prepilin-type N-terminal cleavage/methylation domain-containing protein [Candidatus Wildermuthbacteria bacterium]|nr:prepilin-type N-terminal cleavage/methylation domain-containing protein [Candidatus Wildermuthbacteria bacterium]